MKYPFVAVTLLLGVSACHSQLSPPKTLVAAERMGRSPSVLETESSAPQAKASADALRTKAWKLAENGKTEEASVVAEQASAAYELARALGRRGRASRRIDAARELLSKKKIELATLEADQGRLEGEIEALELRARVLADKQAIGDEEKITPERALARRRAAFVLLSEAEALCVGAKLLGVPAKELDATEVELRTLASSLGQGSMERNILPTAGALRARCLKQLTDLRMRNSAGQPESARNDLFLEEATLLGLPAERDDRGLVLRLTSIAEGPALSPKPTLSPQTLEQLRSIAKLAIAHKDSPLLLVVHTAGQPENHKAAEWGDSAKKLLAAEGAPSVELLLAGHTSPLVQPKSKGAAAQNRRLDVVFVTPEL
jgi:flagellar motor protein MotB